MTLAEQLKALVTVQASEVEVDEVEVDEPKPLNQEALEFILNKCKEAAEAGYPSQKFFVDGIYEEYSSLEKESKFYECNKVLDLLEDPKLGFTLELDDAGDGYFVEVQWGDFQQSWKKPIYVEVEPPEEYLPFIKELLRNY